MEDHRSASRSFDAFEECSEISVKASKRQPLGRKHRTRGRQSRDAAQGVLCPRKFQRTPRRQADEVLLDSSERHRSPLLTLTDDRPPCRLPRCTASFTPTATVLPVGQEIYRYGQRREWIGGSLILTLARTSTSTVATTRLSTYSH